MPALQIEQFGDLLKTTLANFGEPNYTDLMVDLVDYPAAKQLVKTANMTVKTGKSLDWRLKMNHGDAAQNIAITDHDQVNIVDGFVEASVQWRKSNTAYAFYEEEMSINKSPKRIVDLVKSREDSAMVSWIEKLEQNWWAFPAASDIRAPWGVPYWVPKSATAGFTGGIPTGYSSVAGLSPTTYPRWNSYAGPYGAATIDDLIRKARTMAEATGFKPPVATPSTNTGNKLFYGTNLTVKQRLEDMLDAPTTTSARTWRRTTTAPFSARLRLPMSRTWTRTQPTRSTNSTSASSRSASWRGGGKSERCFRRTQANATSSRSSSTRSTTSSATTAA